MIEGLARVPVEVEYASEYRYRDPIVPPHTLGVLITQSGETADTLAAQREIRRLGAPNIAICNGVGSMITREADGVLYTHAGPEIGVAATKTFTTQLTSLFLFALYLAGVRKTVSPEQTRALIEELARVPHMMESCIGQASRLKALARRLFRSVHLLFLGRGIHHPIALEGALKLKEVSYIHASGYPAGEMKHGPNALIDEDLPVIVIATSEAGNPRSTLLYGKDPQQHQGSQGQGRTGHLAGDSFQHRSQGCLRLSHRSPLQQGPPASHPGGRATPAPGLFHRGPPGLRRGSTAKPGQERHRGIDHRSAENSAPDNAVVSPRDGAIINTIDRK